MTPLGKADFPKVQYKFYDDDGFRHCTPNETNTETCVVQGGSLKLEP